MSECADILRRLGEAAGADAAELPGKLGVSVSRGLTWHLTSGLPERIIAAADGADGWLAAAEKTGPAAGAPAVPAGGGWVLVRHDVYPAILPDTVRTFGYTQSIAPGQASARWYRADAMHVRTGLRVSSTEIPPVLKPSADLTVVLTGANDGSTSGAGGFLGAGLLLLFADKEGDAWQVKGQSPVAYASLDAPMASHTRTVSIPGGTPGNVMIVQVGVASAIFSESGINYVYKYQRAP